MTVLYVVEVEVDPAHADRWDAWHSDVHVPEVLQEPGFLSCRKWRDIERSSDGWVRYLVHFELDTRASFDRYTASDAAKRLRAESLTHFGTVTRYKRAVLEEVRSFTAR